MKKYFLFSIVSALSISGAFAQVGYSSNTLTDGNGNPILSKKAAPAEATYLFNKNYQEALLYIEGNSKPMSGTRFKLNLRDNRLLYIDKSGSEMEVASPVARVEFTGLGPAGASVVFVKGLPPIDKQNENTFYQLLVDGKAKLLMHTEFAEVEYKEYNSALTTHRTDKLLSYYGMIENRFAKLARPEDILLLMSDKTQQVSDYIQKEKLKLKKQSDLEKLFKYYNGL